jgi:hypothetical protein
MSDPVFDRGPDSQYGETSIVGWEKAKDVTRQRLAEIDQLEGWVCKAPWQ